MAQIKPTCPLCFDTGLVKGSNLLRVYGDTKAAWAAFDEQKELVCSCQFPARPEVTQRAAQSRT